VERARADVVIRGERGANVIEFAIVAPLLFAVLFGIIDFGWAFSQNLDVKHAAREGARLGAVNAGTGADPDARLDALIAEIRARSPELHDDETQVFVNLADGPADANTTSGDIGDSVIVCMRYPLRSLSGATDVFMSDYLTTKAILRMEKIPNFSIGDGSSSPAWGGSTCAP
jgi:Flp pilus assembly protein TadG